MAEHRIVVPGVVGSSPIFHPIFLSKRTGSDACPFLFAQNVFCADGLEEALTPNQRGSQLEVKGVVGNGRV